MKVQESISVRSAYADPVRNSIQAASRCCRALWITVAVGILSAGAARGVAEDDAWFPFQPARDEFKPAVLDLRAVLNEPQAGSHGRVIAKEANLVFEKTGEPVRFWGVVAESWTWPKEKAQIDYLTRRLAKVGVNLVRLHIPRKDNPPDQFMDTVHYLTHACKQQGIYVALLWYCTANYNELTNCAYFDPASQKQLQEWALTVLKSKNPYTGLSLAQDPAVAWVELLDEDSLFFWTFNPEREKLKPKLPVLEKRFGGWLQKKYGTLTKAAETWGPGQYPPGDDFGAGRAAVYGVKSLVGADWSVAERNPRRAADQVQFMTELMRDWYGGMKTWLAQEAGYSGLVVGSNWKTADERVLGPLDQYANLAVDVTARNTYFGGPCTGRGSGFTVSPGQHYRDATALLAPEQAILMHIQCANRPYLMTEGGWVMPNRFRAEEPFLVAAYYSLQGIDGYCPFRVQADWAIKREWQKELDKWPIQTPVTLGQYPAAALIYRRGYVQEGPVAINEALALPDLYALKGGALSQPLGLDAIQAARVPDPQHAEVASLAGVDPLAFFAGRVVRSIREKPGKSFFHPDLPKLIDRKSQIVRSLTGELMLDYGKGVATINAPCAQGAAGFLQASGEIKLADIALHLKNEYGTVLVVSLDGKPLKESAKILVQVMTEEKNQGWKTEPARTELEKEKGAVDCLQIADIGTAPICVRKFDGQVTLKRADAATLKVTALDVNGYALRELPGGTAPLTLLPDCMYYVVAQSDPR